MNIYLAPMEEVTGYVFRKVYSELFGNIDKYFTPFLTPTQKKILKTKDLKEVWFYLDGSFVINHEYEKYRKIIKKTDDDIAYVNAVKNIFSLQME